MGLAEPYIFVSLEKTSAIELKVPGAEHPDADSTQEWLDDTKR